MSKTYNKKEIISGLFLLCGILFLFALASLSKKGSPIFVDTYTILAKFDEVGGLSKKSPVKISGVPIGQVSNITLGKTNYLAQVTMDIDVQYSLPIDTTADILTSGILGKQFVALSPGAEDELLKDGDTIEHTQSAISIEKLINQFIFNR